MKTFLKPLDSKEEERCIRLMREGNPEEARKARELLIEHNLRLVAHIIKKYQFTDEDMEDLLSTGTIGLIKAVDTFDASKGRLATYACRCIDNELLMLLRAKKKSRGLVSLYDPVGCDKEGNEMQLIDVIEDSTPDLLEKLVKEGELSSMRRAMLERLTEREYTILVLRYGLLSGEEMTQSQVGSLLGISRSYVSRIEKKALEQLRQSLLVK